MKSICFSVSPEAGRIIDRFAEEAGLAPSASLRIDVIGGANSGFAYDFYFDDPQEHDLVIEVGARRLCIAWDAAPYLDGSTLDWVTSDNGAGFYIDNPNEPNKT